MVSGTVIAVLGGMAVAEESMPGSDMLKKAQTQQEKVMEQEKKADNTVKKADKAKETVKKKEKKRRR